MKLIQVLENIKNNDDMYMYDKVDILFKIADDYDVHEILDQIVTDDEIDEILRGRINEGNSWESIAIFLCDVRLLNQKYYFIDGYGNLSNLSLRQFNIILDDFIEEIKFKGLGDIVIEKEI